MSNPPKRRYVKGLVFFHKTTKQKILFGAWNSDGTASCLNMKDKSFITLTREELDKDYESYADLEKEAREKRRGQAWK